jgi:hypothetical protein
MKGQLATIFAQCKRTEESMEHRAPVYVNLFHLS